jgi:hypothetical protein
VVGIQSGDAVFLIVMLKGWKVKRLESRKVEKLPKNLNFNNLTVPVFRTSYLVFLLPFSKKKFAFHRGKVPLSCLYNRKLNQTISSLAQAYSRAWAGNWNKKSLLLEK